jgi:LmbE family N-acetylglucosaminyl deacetylase
MIVQHLYLSPHLDDAILSCGGLIHKQRTAGETVAVMTLCAGEPDCDALSPFAEQYHIAWGNPDNPVETRRVEDSAVLGSWGVTAYHCDTQDSIYRRINGRYAYPDLATLFNDPHPQELWCLPRVWQAGLKSLYPDSTGMIIYAPLAAGNHVDHQLVRTLAMQLLEAGEDVWFYEDYPHVESVGSLNVAKSWFGTESWQTKTTAIDIRAKLAAISGYKSQLRSTFRGGEAMTRDVKQYTSEVARDLSVGERIRDRLAGTDGRRARLWRAVLGYHAHAERIWRPL